jgi:S1-C subfamily serine protease
MTGQSPAAQDLPTLESDAIHAALARLAPSIVEIETSGGTDLIASGSPGPQVRKGTGPTTGLVVAADGYIISSAFNFANKPTAIFVAVPGHKEHHVARVIATDHTRMLTLLKIDANGLTVPPAAPRTEIRVGMTALALGRTWMGAEQPPSVSTGIVSAVDRIWGRAIQTDAKVSPVNYGGPLADLRGRVLGVLVPASPNAEDETAGIEWYDSGIGFAIPFEDIQAVLPRLKEGRDLRRGLLGVETRGQDIYRSVPVVARVTPDSPAAKVGIKPGDVVLEVAGVPVVRQAQILHALGKKYEGDTVSLKVRRGKEEITVSDLKLVAKLRGLAQTFLGVLPMRDDAEVGVAARYIYSKSPADAAGLKIGDRILAIGPASGRLQSVTGRDQLLALLSRVPAGTEIKLEVRPKDSKETKTLSLRLGELPDDLPSDLPEPASLGKATPTKESTEDKPAEAGVLARTNAAADHDYWLYVPKNYSPSIAHALIIWLHAPGIDRIKDRDTIVNAWKAACEKYHCILVGPQAQGDNGWLASEAGAVRDLIGEVAGQYTIDRRRVVAHGAGAGGQMAYYLGFHAPEQIQGVAVIGALLPGEVPDTLPARVSFFLATSALNPLAHAVQEAKARLAAQGFPVVYREIDSAGAPYMDAAALRELLRWIDSLDRI